MNLNQNVGGDDIIQMIRDRRLRKVTYWILINIAIIISSVIL